MGNQQSTLNEPFEQISVCDTACQRQKQLDGLLTTMNNTEKTNPVEYEKARVSYYTLKDGQEWLVKEKDRLAKEEVEPILKNIDTKYEYLQKKVKDKKQQEDLINSLKLQEVGDEEETRYINNQLMKEKDKVGVAQRLSLFNTSSSLNVMPYWLSTTLDITIALLSLFIAYSLFNKFRTNTVS
jgi:intergrase/recombinase